ncbi:hypothetical protein EC912_103107 [Luteibacter rhizovicinus]|uniref:Uncharacterized protein n=1 Tax=Luteibacter rhizovicinus TaxID=242606 RepID=A0A4R3YQJ9_9GAMM|nr:hypothetical protein [Luteibacter rhizovicinus]TCV94622.1 hypothetical protein EC912_103107 [Luteibacter rhizovicinus]
MRFRFERPWTLIATFAFTLVLAWMFANVEIQIEGGAGWATSLPTWRIERHWLLDLLWGGRAMTGYHAWVFPFIALFFHFPMVFQGRWTWRAEVRAIACVMIFWVTEDLLWFVLNPAWGLGRFNPVDVPWHKHWWGVAPTDYWVYGALGLGLFVLSGWHSRQER